MLAPSARQVVVDDGGGVVVVSGAAKRRKSATQRRIARAREQRRRRSSVARLLLPLLFSMHRSTCLPRLTLVLTIKSYPEMILALAPMSPAKLTWGAQRCVALLGRQAQVAHGLCADAAVLAVYASANRPARLPHACQRSRRARHVDSPPADDVRSEFAQGAVCANVTSRLM